MISIGFSMITFRPLSIAMIDGSACEPLGVATWSYAPFAIFCFVSPVITVAIAYAGIRMMHTTPAPANTVH